MHVLLCGRLVVLVCIADHPIIRGIESFIVEEEIATTAEFLGPPISGGHEALLADGTVVRKCSPKDRLPVADHIGFLDQRIDFVGGIDVVSFSKVSAVILGNAWSAEFRCSLFEAWSS